MSYFFVTVMNDIEKEKAKMLLALSFLSYDDNVTNTYNLYDGDELIGTISTYLNVIKMVAVLPERQGELITNELMHYVMRKFEIDNVSKYFLFTKPENKSLFSSFHLKLIVETKTIALFENSIWPIQDTLYTMKTKLMQKHGKRACLVMNCNPMTLGHLYLIEKASKENHDVLVFIVEENLSVFPFDVRFSIVQKACKHLKNVTVLPSTCYIISRATFPTYFIKDASSISREYMTLDITLFKNYFMSIFDIDVRYVGTEPYDETTRLYNETMQSILTDQLIIVDRLTVDKQVVSASYIRYLILEKHYQRIKKLVPKPTYQYLKSKEGTKLFHES